VDGVIGEVMAFAASWTREGVLDGVMNYWFRETVLALLTGRLSSEAAERAIQIQLNQFPAAGLQRSWNILSSHDTPRLATLLPQESQRRVALALQFFLPGIPVLYYGEELGMHGGPDPDNRRPMDWSEADRTRPSPGNLTPWIQRLAKLRTEQTVLKSGEVRFGISNASSGLLTILRQNPDNPTDFAVLVVNPSDKACGAEETVLIPCEGMFDALPMVNALSDNRLDSVVAQSGSIRLRYFPAMSAALFLPAPGSIPAYNFFKPCWTSSLATTGPSLGADLE
jgi:alpha-glucosidase